MVSSHDVIVEGNQGQNAKDPAYQSRPEMHPGDIDSIMEVESDESWFLGYLS
jgi:hypothetical protein